MICFSLPLCYAGCAERQYAGPRKYASAVIHLMKFAFDKSRAKFSQTLVAVDFECRKDLVDDDDLECGGEDASGNGLTRAFLRNEAARPKHVISLNLYDASVLP
jgi:hypothetical protein